MITWLIGKNENVDVLWSEYDYETITNIEIIKNINLFEKKNYKYNFDKKYTNFFIQNRNNFNSSVIIKGISKFDEKIMDSQDEIINIDTIDKNTLFNHLIKLKNIKFHQKENEFIKINVENLAQLCCIITLKNLNIEQEFWKNFIKSSKENWSLKLKNNMLIEDCIVKNENIITMMQYVINANYIKKPIMLFLQNEIKSGKQIWQLSKIWDSVILKK